MRYWYGGQFSLVRAPAPRSCDSPQLLTALRRSDRKQAHILVVTDRQELTTLQTRLDVSAAVLGIKVGSPSWPPNWFHV